MFAYKDIIKEMYIHANTCIYKYLLLYNLILCYTILVYTCKYGGSIMATKSSDVMMSIRLPKELRDSFAKVCEERNQTASRVIKSFMEDYVKKAEAEKKE